MYLCNTQSMISFGISPKIPSSNPNPLLDLFLNLKRIFLTIWVKQAVYIKERVLTKVIWSLYIAQGYQ